MKFHSADELLRRYVEQCHLLGSIKAQTMIVSGIKRASHCLGERCPGKPTFKREHRASSRYGTVCDSCGRVWPEVEVEERKSMLPPMTGSAEDRYTRLATFAIVLQKVEQHDVWALRAWWLNVIGDTIDAKPYANAPAISGMAREQVVERMRELVFYRKRWEAPPDPISLYRVERVWIPTARRVVAREMLGRHLRAEAA